MKPLSRFMLILFTGMVSLCSAQSAFTLKYVGLTVHPFGDNSADVQPFKLDPEARFVVNIGGLAGYERFIYEDFISVKITQGIFTDCAASIATATHLGLRAVVLDKKRLQLVLALGPLLYSRQSWTRFKGYRDNGYFREIHTGLLGDMQWRAFPVVPEIEINYKVSSKFDISSTILTAVPLSFAIGFRYWFNKNFKIVPQIYKPS